MIFVMQLYIIYIVSITNLSVGEFLLVRLRRWAGVFRLWACAFG